MRKISDIAVRAIELIEKYGKRLEVDNLPGFAESLETESFTIIYTTPFSGAEVYPGEKMYMIDIWHEGQKVLGECFQNIEEIRGKDKSKRTAWVEEFFELKR
ncbi:hypothetical protein L1D44_21395 [Shewanella sp. Isolate13]|uniref:hypothetical protein n=1 Tax=Shewanella sp. Isolate13 TaxID=2908531 RepID=UPI001EFD505F|nr:hypothetical protein [Shewanella sp. Isolate13]MCG9732339.1 hypothetical protein [Shewanella sp. Isolate13]